MTGGTVERKEIAARGHRRRIARKFEQAFAVDRGEPLLERAASGRLFALVLRYFGPMLDAAEIPEPWVEGEIAKTEHDRQHEQPQPPARHRIVVFGQIVVPRVSGLVGG